MSRWPCQAVEPIQHWPERCTAAMTRSVVASSSPNRTSTWFKTTSLTTQMPSMAASWAAKRRARPQQRSASSVTPLRPSSRSAAQVANPRARRDEHVRRGRGVEGAPDDEAEIARTGRRNHGRLDRGHELVDDLARRGGAIRQPAPDRRPHGIQVDFREHRGLRGGLSVGRHAVCAPGEQRTQIGHDRILDRTKRSHPPG